MKDNSNVKPGRSVFEHAKATFLRYAAPLNLKTRFPGMALPERLIIPDKTITFRL